ncbi:hypothetical protein [Flavobacterium sp.]|uniref:hypothetical protein n=1 Tax=Flavobacterium sp. TaxID=239 RepID=UPI003D6C3387
MFCVFEGQVNDTGFTEITLNRKFHPTFKWLFILGYLTLYIPILIPSGALTSKLLQIIFYNLYIFTIRYFLIKSSFGKPEKKGIEMLKNKLKLIETD